MHGNALILATTLALAGVAGGVLLGIVALFRREGLRFWTAFAIHLGVLCMVASTHYGTLEVVPLALVLGAAAGIVPFAIGFHLVRTAGRQLLRRRTQGEAAADTRPP